jgi:hypothetical protein
MESRLSEQTLDEHVESLKKQYHLGQITRRELLNKLFVAGVAAPVAYGLIGQMSANAAGQAPGSHLVKWTKPIEETAQADWLGALKKEGITSLEQLVESALQQAKGQHGQPKAGIDIWVFEGRGWAFLWIGQGHPPD